MKAIVIENYGDVNEMKQVAIDSPQLNATDVMIEVHAVSVNPIEWKIRAGYMKDFMPVSLPLVLGTDISGVVKEVGEEVKGFKIGDAVIGKAEVFKMGGVS